jgi:transcriptional regulator
MEKRKSWNKHYLEEKIKIIDKVLYLRDCGKTMREIGKIIKKSRKEVQNIKDSNRNV